MLYLIPKAVYNDIPFFLFKKPTLRIVKTQKGEPKICFFEPSKMGCPSDVGPMWVRCASVLGPFFA